MQWGTFLNSDTPLKEPHLMALGSLFWNQRTKWLRTNTKKLMFDPVVLKIHFGISINKTSSLYWNLQAYTKWGLLCYDYHTKKQTWWYLQFVRQPHFRIWSELIFVLFLFVYLLFFLTECFLSKYRKFAA